MAHVVTNILSIKEACTALGIHRSTLWRWIKQGKIKTITDDGRVWIFQPEIDAVKKEILR